MRPGCDRGAAARLTYDPVGCEVWLDDLAERVGRHQEICTLHAERLTVPRGWTLSDRRSDEPTMFVAPAAPVAPVAAEPAAPRRRRRAAGKGHPATQTLELFEVLRQELAEAEAAPVAAAVVEPIVEPAPEPVVEPIVEPAAEPVAEPAAEVESASELAGDELPEALQATSPLLARAFAATGHQRSVLTQRGPTDPAAAEPNQE
jgi:hypothetical protein